MRDLREPRRRRGAYPASRAVAADQLGKARLDRRVALAQPVVFGVADLGHVLRVVKLIVMRDLGGETGELALCLLFGQQFDRARRDVWRRRLRFHGRAPAIRLAAAARASAVIVLPDSMRAISSWRVSGSSSSTEVIVACCPCFFATRPRFPP